MNISRNLEQSDLVLDRHISIDEATAVAAGSLRVKLSKQAEIRCSASHERLRQLIRENRHVYGITTGFGPLANRMIGSDQGVELQRNLIHHLASGIGDSFCWLDARAIVLARLMSILQGASGASSTLIQVLTALLNSDFAPQLPARGTVGASGDLTPLAHMALCLQGRGTFLTKNQDVVSAEHTFEQLAIAPLSLADRDGLALVNGTSAMTGVAVLNARRIDAAVSWAVATTAILMEVLPGRAEAWQSIFAELRPHAGQIQAAERLRRRIEGSDHVITGNIADRVLDSQGTWVEATTGQDAYTLRCAPQVIGAVVDLADWHSSIIQQELCSATDNPLFPSEDHGESAPLALHGGNFMGQHVALASDAVANGIVALAGLVERQVARLTDEKLNNGLPAFLHQGTAGLNSGFMGAQVTSTALLAEMRSSGPASIHSISTNGANQDVVSMGTIAARLVSEKLQLLSHIQAIMCMTTAQAMDIRMKEEPQKQFSASAKAVHRFVRGVSPELVADRPLGREIEEIANAISDDPPPC